MFNFNNSKDESVSKEKSLKADLLKFSSSQKKDEFLSSVAAKNKFVKEDLKMRSMVVDMLEKEFGKNIKNTKDYNFLVDSVVNKLKKQQLDKEEIVDV